MRHYEANSTINASPDEVWAVLADAPSYPEWDSGVERVEGEIAPGKRPLIWRSMPDLGPSFRQFASGLKQRAEA